jgi:two-component system, sporulation sensor kinase E
MGIRDSWRSGWMWMVVLTALLLVMLSLLYSNFLVSRLAIEEERRVELLAKAQEFIGTLEDESCELNFILENILKGNESVPVIFADSAGNILEHRNIVDSLASGEKKQEQLTQTLAEMKASGIPPVPILLGPKSDPTALVLYVYYSESWLLKQLRWFPYFQLLVIGVFILFVFIGYALAKRSEQNKIWVGMARETAHQLGTPISGMIAWVELLRMEELRSEDRAQYLGELESDIIRLQNIAERFSRIGSTPDLHPESPASLLADAVEYVRKRLPRKAEVLYTCDLPESVRVPLDANLFAWVIENLVKNALDALPDEQGKIQIRTFIGKKGDVIIEVEDNGKGISPKNIVRVFDTGFTTKKRGWGLGLSLSKRIIEGFFKGRIMVLRSEPGKGTTFRIILPKNA